MRENKRQMLIKCPNCGKKYYLSIAEELFGKTVRVQCINTYCSGSIIQSVPVEEVWQSRPILYTINPKTLSIKYYDAKNDIREFVWTKNTLIIGRNPKEELGFDALKILDPSVSANHCLLGTRWDVFSQTAIYRIKDLGSTNGTFINGRKLESNVKYDLSEKDLILSGNFQLLFNVK